MDRDVRLRTRIRVQALLRHCQSRGVFAAVVVSGDPDAGAVLVKVNTLGSGCWVLSQVRLPDGRPAWMRGTGERAVTEQEADAYIARQRGYDDDLWVIEVEDRNGWHPLIDEVLL
ncbi:DUF1491 family protein [Haematospirillum sp. 15-248]|uniref:DUF1491 family protein n=1 Tax=Haematospirillum sp. 15-248 TaxID=2723107 RepID=UPI00143B8C69|nr:DUF1491 family protein [Haematospirillum sp. 15-248]NKD87131.1 DUF1491 family protein [Haematospirillum sp. 15-248]